MGTEPVGLADLGGRVAVITGAASGIGRSLAQRLAAADMCVVIADIEQDPLNALEAELTARGTNAMAVRVDVSNSDSTSHLAAVVQERFGTPALLCANAGVAMRRGRIWEVGEDEWDWMLGVNLMGVVHTVQAMVPSMIEADQPAHVLITSSAAGLFGGPGGVYDITKHAVTRYAEVLWHDLRSAGAQIGVSVLCPGRVATRLVTSARNRAGAGGPIEDDVDRSAEREAKFGSTGMPPNEVADIALDAVRNGRFYVHTHEWPLAEIDLRLRAILNGAEPPARLYQA